MRKVTKKQADAAAREISIIRETLDGETQLLCQTHNPRLVMYALLTQAVRLAPAAGHGPDDFARLTSDVIKLYTGEQAGKPFIAIVEFREDE